MTTTKFAFQFLNSITDSWLHKIRTAQNETTIIRKFKYESPPKKNTMPSYIGAHTIILCNSNLYFIKNIDNLLWLLLNVDNGVHNQHLSLRTEVETVTIFENFDESLKGKWFVENGKFKSSPVLELFVCWGTNSPIYWIEVAKGRKGFSCLVWGTSASLVGYPLFGRN